MKNGVFITLVIISILLALFIKGFVLGGIFAGLVSTICVWLLVLKLPERMKYWMGRHALISDFILTMGSASVLATIGPGITMFVAIVVQGSLLSLLLKTL